jgi:hypothetical protein
MQPDNGAQDVVQRLVTMSINTLEQDKVKGSDTKIVVERADESVPQLTVHIL